MPPVDLQLLGHNCVPFAFNVDGKVRLFFNTKHLIEGPQKHITRFLPQGNISPGTKLEEGKGNAASGNDSSLLRAMMMWSHRAQTYYSQIIDMFLFIFTQQGPTVRWTCSKRKTSSELVT